MYIHTHKLYKRTHTYTARESKIQGVDKKLYITGVDKKLHHVNTNYIHKIYTYTPHMHAHTKSKAWRRKGLKKKQTTPAMIWEVNWKWMYHENIVTPTSFGMFVGEGSDVFV